MTKLEDQLKCAMEDVFKEFSSFKKNIKKKSTIYYHPLVHSEHDAMFLILKYMTKNGIKQERIRTELSITKQNFENADDIDLKKPDIIILNANRMANIISEDPPYSEAIPFDAVIEVKRITEVPTTSTPVRWFEKGYNKDLKALESIMDNISKLKAFIVFDDFNHFEESKIKYRGKKYKFTQYFKETKGYYKIDWKKVSLQFPSTFLFIITIYSFRTYKNGKQIL